MNKGFSDFKWSDISDLSWQAKTAAGVTGVKEGVNQYFSSVTKRLQFKQQAQQYEAQARLNMLQAQQSRRQTYDIHRSYDWAAMQQGLADRAKLGQIRASQSGSGVLMGSGSAKEVENSQKMTAELNQIALQQNATNADSQSRIQTANYLAAAEINKGNAQAAETMRKSIDTFSNILSGTLLGFGESLLNSAQIGAWGYGYNK